MASVAFSPDGTRLVVGSGNSVGRARGVGVGLALPGNTAAVVDATTGAQLFGIDCVKGLVHAVAFSPDGKTIVSGSGDETLKVWDAGAWALIPLNPHAQN